MILNRITLLEIIYSLIGSPKSHQNTIISRTVSYLIDNIEENPSISDLARRFGVSTVYLRRKFKEVMGTSPAKYRNDLRLKAAVSYLKFGDITVQEISDTLGYATVSHFIKEFKTRYGISPLKYRKTQCI
jgi:AraC-like DNA-binding protein